MLNREDLKSIKEIVGTAVSESEKRVKAAVDVKIEMAIKEMREEN